MKLWLQSSNLFLCNLKHRTLEILRSVFEQRIWFPDLQTISPTFYDQLFCQFPFVKNLQTQTVCTEKLNKTLYYEKGARKMCVRLRPLVNFTNILWAAFGSISLRQKITNSYSKQIKTAKNTSIWKSRSLFKSWWDWDL